MRREVMWSAWDAPGLEHLRLVMHNDGVVADGTVIGVTEGRPFSAVVGDGARELRFERVTG